MKKTFLAAALLAAGIGYANAEAISANGLITVSVKASGNLVEARRIARERAEDDAVIGLLKRVLSADTSRPEVVAALPDLRKQLIDNMQTSFKAEGDVLEAKTLLQVDSAEFMKMARAYRITSQVASNSASVLFLIDEYYGVATQLDPSKPLVTEIDYSHNKNSYSDHTATASGASSASSSSASASKSSLAAASSQRSAFAGSSSASLSARDKGSYSASNSASFDGSAAGRGGSVDVSAARNSRASGSHDTSISGSQKSAVAASSSSQAAMSASASHASASKSAKASSFSARQNAVDVQHDEVNLKIRQVFPGIDNAKPSDEASAMISQKLQQVVKEYGIGFTEERDFRVEGGRRLTNVEINRMSKASAYMKKAGQRDFNAKYLVYGTALMNSEGTMTNGQTACSGQLQVSSSNVMTGVGLMAGTVVKRAFGSSDQNCRANLSEAIARELASTIGNAAQQEIQQAATLGSSYTLDLYSASRVPAKLRRFFDAKVRALPNIVEVAEDDIATEGLRRWNVVAKGNFATEVEDLIDEIAEMDGSAYQSARFERRGNQLMFCVDGKCPTEI